jgi:hypothetical protein
LELQVDEDRMGAILSSSTALEADFDLATDYDSDTESSLSTDSDFDQDEFEDDGIDQDDFDFDSAKEEIGENFCRSESSIHGHKSTPKGL